MIKFKCRTCGQEVAANDYEKSNYCPKCGTFLQKVYVENFVGKNIDKKIRLRPMDIHVDAMWNDYLEQPIPLFGSATVYPIQWANKRKLFYQESRRKFSPNNLLDLNIVFKNNCSWTTYQRKGTKALEQPEKLARLLFDLQNENLEVADRVRNGLGANKVAGVGQSILTSLLHTFNDQKYGVWNSKTSETIGRLYRKPKIGKDIGQNYVAVNHTLNELAKELYLMPSSAATLRAFGVGSFFQ
jgi:hypothetical protein